MFGLGSDDETKDLPKKKVKTKKKFSLEEIVKSSDDLKKDLKKFHKFKK